MTDRRIEANRAALASVGVPMHALASPEAFRQWLEFQSMWRFIPGGFEGCPLCASAVADRPRHVDWHVAELSMA